MLSPNQVVAEYRCGKCDRLRMNCAVNQYMYPDKDHTKIVMICKCGTYIATVNVYQEKTVEEYAGQEASKSGAALKKKRVRKNVSTGFGGLGEPT